MPQIKHFLYTEVYLILVLPFMPTYIPTFHSWKNNPPCISAYNLQPPCSPPTPFLLPITQILWTTKPKSFYLEWKWSWIRWESRKWILAQLSPWHTVTLSKSLHLFDSFSILKKWKSKWNIICHLSHCKDLSVW